MNRNPIVWLTALTLTGCAAAQAPAQQEQPQPPQPVAEAQPPAAAAAGAPVGQLTPESSVEQVLSVLDVRGENLDDFTADVQLTESDNITMLETTRLGTVWFQRQQPGDARIRVLLDRLKTDRGTKKEQVEYLLDDGWLTDRDYRKQINVRRQVLKPGERVDLLKLGEGPFPLPLGQDPEQVKGQFDVAKIGPKPEDPQGTVHVQLVPKPGTQFADRITTLDVWVDLESGMPRRIETVSGDTISTTDLTNLKVNTGLADADFTLPPIDLNTWQDRTEAFQ